MAFKAMPLPWSTKAGKNRSRWTAQDGSGCRCQHGYHVYPETAQECADELNRALSKAKAKRKRRGDLR